MFCISLLNTKIYISRVKKSCSRTGICSSWHTHKHGLQSFSSGMLAKEEQQQSNPGQPKLKLGPTLRFFPPPTSTAVLTNLKPKAELPLASYHLQVKTWFAVHEWAAHTRWMELPLLLSTHISVQKFYCAFYFKRKKTTVNHTKFCLAV